MLQKNSCAFFCKLVNQSKKFLHSMYLIIPYNVTVSWEYNRQFTIKVVCPNNQNEQNKHDTSHGKNCGFYDVTSISWLEYMHVQTFEYLHFKIFIEIKFGRRISRLV